MHMRIHISLTDSEGHTEMHPIDVEAEMPEMGDRIIDDVEQAVLALNKEAIRAAIVGYLEELSKKKPEMRQELMAELSRLMPDSTQLTANSDYSPSRPVR